jgi:hypothetical protein
MRDIGADRPFSNAKWLKRHSISLIKNISQGNIGMRPMQAFWRNAARPCATRLDVAGNAVDSFQVTRRRMHGSHQSDAEARLAHPQRLLYKGDAGYPFM